MRNTKYPLLDKNLKISDMSNFDRAMYQIQLLGKLTELRNTYGYKNIRSRVKTVKSIMNKYAYLETTDLTSIQDIVGITIIQPSINECYQVFEDFLKRGFVPYYKLLDTLKEPINNYSSLDTYFKNDRDSFELQIRTIEADKLYLFTHEQYKKRTKVLNPNRKLIFQIKQQFEKIETLEFSKNINSIFDLLIELTPSPKECFRWRILKSTSELNTILNSYNIEIPDFESDYPPKINII